MEQKTISKRELLSALNINLTAIKIMIEKGRTFYSIVEALDNLESLLLMRRDVNWVEEKYTITYRLIYSEFMRVKENYLNSK